MLKSRYQALLPVAQHLKTAQEAYYTGNSYYSDDLSTLDLDVPGTITSATTATYGDNMSAKISTQEDEEEEYSYVLASKEGLNNNYIMYQEYSKNYPGEIHCEVKNGDSYAQWLCEKGLSGQKLEQGSITPGYTTYVLSGTGNGTFLKECTAEKELEDTSCACGKRTRTTTGCDEKTGEWEYGEWSSCPVKPSEEENCDSGVNAKMTRTVTCQDNAWTEPAWDKHLCCNPNDTNKPSDQYICHDNDANTCGIKTRTVSCGTDGQWIADDNAWTGTCEPQPTAATRNCYSQNSNTCGIQTQDYNCNENGQWVALGTWTGTCHNKPEDYSFTGCDDGLVGCDGPGETSYTYQCTETDTNWKGKVTNSTCCSPQERPGGIFYHNHCNTYEHGSCSGYKFEDWAWCTSTISNGCNGNTYENAYCVTSPGSIGYSCNDSTFSESGSCEAWTTNSCNNNTFKSGTRCVSLVRGTSANVCNGTYEEGAYCTVSNGGICPAGSPTQDGKCWDGNGNKVACS